MAVKWILYLHAIPKEISRYDHDKYYVGITSRKPIDRWGSKGQYYRGVFKNAIDKYGWDNIRHEILFTDLTEEQAQNLEIAHIQILKSNIKKYGYNRTDGGAGANKKCMLASGYQWSYEKLDNIGKYSPIIDSHNIYRKEKNGNIK